MERMTGVFNSAEVTLLVRMRVDELDCERSEGSVSGGETEQLSEGGKGVRFDDMVGL